MAGQRATRGEDLIPLSRGLVRAVADVTRDGLVLFDTEHRVHFMNDAARDLVHAEDTPLQDLRLEDLVDPHDHGRMVALLNEVTFYGRTSSTLNLRDLAGGDHRHVPVRFERMPNEGKEEFILLVMELTELAGDVVAEARTADAKVATALLAAARASAQATSPEELCSLTARAFFSVYPAPIVAVHLADWDREELHLVAAEGESRPWVDRGWRLAIDPESPSLLVQAAIKKRTLVKDRLELVQGFSELPPSPRGEITPQEVAATFSRIGIRALADVPIMYEGELLGVIGVGTRTEEISKPAVSLLELLAHEIASGLNRLDLEAARERLLDATQLAYEELAEFTYNLSHDVSEELRRVVTFTGALQDDYGDVLPPDGIDLTRRTNEIAKGLQRRIKGSLEISRYLSRGPLERRVLELEDYVEDAKQRVLASAEDHPPRIHVARPMPMVWADPATLPLLLNHLLHNAVRFNPRPDREVWVSAHHDDGAVEIRVEDNGPGIPEEYRAHIFGAFRKLPAHERGESAGVGLALVKKLVEHHGGTIRVTDREEGPGASFRIRLPERDSRP